MTNPEEMRQLGYSIEQSRTRTHCWNVVYNDRRLPKNHRSECEAWEAAAKHAGVFDGARA